MSNIIISKITIGSPVTVYDRYRFAKPLRGEVLGFAEKNDGVRVLLHESNNNNYPVGSSIWVHKFQLRPVTPTLKPPLGLRPRKVIEEERLFEINHAIKRYVDTNKKIPREWMDEYYEIMEKLYG